MAVISIKNAELKVCQAPQSPPRLRQLAWTAAQAAKSLSSASPHGLHLSICHVQGCRHWAPQEGLTAEHSSINISGTGQRKQQKGVTSSQGCATQSCTTLTKQ